MFPSHDQELVVTSALDGEHSSGSYHYYGLALDFRTRYFTESVKTKVRDDLVSALPQTFITVLHDTHMHVQYYSLYT